MGKKNNDGSRRATKKIIKKKHSQKYGVYTSRACRIKLAQMEAQNANSKKVQNNKKTRKRNKNKKRNKYVVVGGVPIFFICF